MPVRWRSPTNQILNLGQFSRFIKHKYATIEMQETNILVCCQRYLPDCTSFQYISNEYNHNNHVISLLLYITIFISYIYFQSNLTALLGNRENICFFCCQSVSLQVFMCYIYWPSSLTGQFFLQKMMCLNTWL